jgi:peptidoglycan/xylan/chitin deacetylase (PgdA/CDA1 family)
MFFDFSKRKTGVVAVIIAALLFGVAAFIAVDGRYFVVDRAKELTRREFSSFSYYLLYGIPLEGVRLAAAAGLTADPNPPLGAENAKSVPVLLYHGEGDASSISRGRFVEQLEALRADGWHTVTFEQFTAFMQGKATLPDKSFLLTFDDGRRDTFYGFDPVLKDLGYTGVMFVITGFSLPDNGPKAINGFYLDKAELAYLAATGRWEIESHGDEDHRNYDVPTATSTAAAVGYIAGQHFLSERLWLPDEKRIETDAEFASRVAQDLSYSKKLLETDFGKPVEGFAYPYNDYGVTSVNYPAAESVLAGIVPRIYSYAFYQTWPGNGDTFMYPDPSAYFIKRIEPDKDWSGAEMVAALDGGRAKPLPYTATAFGPDWQTNWGDVTTRTALQLHASADTDGAAAFLNGTEWWTDYRLSADVKELTGTFSLVARHTENEKPYLVCAFAEDRIYLERHTGENQVTLKSTPFARPAIAFSPSMTVKGGTAACSANGTSVSAPVSVTTAGGAGVIVWTPEANQAAASITRVSVESL